MTSNDIELVQSSFAKVIPIADTAAGLFYARLFETAPEVRPMFKGDMTEQGRKLMATLVLVVKGLSDIEAILPAAQSLAVRHESYGVRPEHYAPVGAALIWTLAQGLGEDFTTDTEQAWTAAYGVLSKAMIAAAYAGHQPAAE